MWTNNLSRLRLADDPAIVDRAFELLIAGKQPEEQTIPVRTVEPTSTDADEAVIERFLIADAEDTPFE